MNAGTRGIFLTLLISACAAFVLYGAQGVLTKGIVATFFQEETDAALFVGDIMLARDVETRVQDGPKEHFFDGVLPLHERARYVVANFEATAGEEYVPTPHLTFRFSVDRALLPLLTRARISHASLANNHADDYGASVRAETIEVLEANGIRTFGMPRGVASTSVTTFMLEEKTVSVIGLEDVLAPLDVESALSLIREEETKSDAQVIYIHWGSEYELTHNERQEELAQQFVEAGADAVIGHHPHVVQDVAYIEGVPVVYSLGNYVFDQYWDAEVQKGLTALATFNDDGLSLELIPIRIDRAKPSPMSMEESRDFLETVARRSDEKAKNATVRGALFGRLQ